MKKMSMDQSNFPDLYIINKKLLDIWSSVTRTTHILENVVAKNLYKSN